MQQPQGERLQPAIIYAPVARLILYEVTESELDQLEEGSPVAIHLNFAIFLLSIAASFFTSILTATLSDKTYLLFLTLTIVAALIGIFLLLLWKQKSRSVTSLIKTIKDRLPSEGIQQLSL